MLLPILNKPDRLKKFRVAAITALLPAMSGARCLTAMREELVTQTQARIMMGGKMLDYKGKYPGLVEEALLTLAAGKPLFLLGGYGGATRVIIEALQGRQPEQLTQDYQCTSISNATLMREFNQQLPMHRLIMNPSLKRLPASALAA